jgi:excisionase family DNA binding protein
LLPIAFILISIDRYGYDIKTHLFYSIFSIYGSCGNTGKRVVVTLFNKQIHTIMGVIILTEEQVRSMAIESGKAALQDFIKSFFPNFPDLSTSQKQPEQDQMFTVKQLAEYWQCHEQTIMQKKRKGELAFYQHGRKLMFRKSEIDKLTANPLPKKGR